MAIIKNDKSNWNAYKNTINIKNLFLRLVISMPPHVSINKINDSKK